MTPLERSRCMAAVRSKNTKPEIIVRRFLFAKGLRFRVNVRKLPGTPDIVLRKWKTIVFVNGCFWHGHEGCRYYRLPSSNVEFWQEKLIRNRARDLRADAELIAGGWRVIRIWECEVRTKSNREATLERLYRQITERSEYSCSPTETDYDLAAESCEPYGE